MSSLLHRIDESLITEERFLACIEIAKGSKNKYEYDEEMDALKLDRILFTSTHYPHNYGFIPKTWGLDDDPLDVLVISSESILPLALVQCGKSDEKILAVCLNDPIYSGYEDIHQLPKHLFEESRHFFTVDKQLELGKHTEIEGFSGREEAIKTIRRAKARYHEKFGEQSHE